MKGAFSNTSGSRNPKTGSEEGNPGWAGLAGPLEFDCAGPPCNVSTAER